MDIFIIVNGLQTTEVNRAFSHDVTAAILVFQNDETAEGYH